MAIGNYSHAKLLSLIKKQSAANLPEPVGDITAVTAQNGLSGGGTSGDVALEVDITGSIDGTGITISHTDLVLVADADDSNIVKKVYVHQLTASNQEPAGSNTEIQFNNNGAFGASANLTYNGSQLSISGSNISGSNNTLVGGATLYGVGVAASGIGGDDGAPVFGIPSSGNGQFQNNLFIKDDKKIYFGDAGESHIEYNEDGDDFMTISGSANGIVLSGSTIQIDGTLQGASPLKIGGEVQFISDGSQNAFKFGPNQEASIYYQDLETSALVISGSVVNGIIMSGSGLYVDNHVGIGVGEGNATHGLTLPDNSDASGQVKANAFLSYSSIRFKEEVEPLEDPIGTLKKLNGVSYRWKDTGKLDYGFIAEEVGKVLPEIVEWSADPEYANSMDYIRIISFLVEGAKAQDKKISDLENKLNLLVEKLDKIDV